MKECYLYKKLKNKQVQCIACNHYCSIKNNETGICGVRKNVDGKLMLLVYGKAAAVNIDQIEKKPLFHFLPGSDVYSFGTVGCNFKCGFCQNWGISQVSKEKHGRQIWGQDLSPAQIVNYCLKNNIPSIAFTYNEPSVYFEYIYDTAKLAHQNKIKTIFVSNGFISQEAFEMIKKYLDAANIDLKSFSNSFYLKTCGGKLQPVLDNIKRFHQAKIHQEITTLLIPGQNDSSEEINQIAEFIASLDKSIPWHISRFFPQYEFEAYSPTDVITLEKAYRIGKKAGLNYVYIGNLPTTKYENTYCPKCNGLVIERYGYQVRRLDKNGRCVKCNYKINLVL